MKRSWILLLVLIFVLAFTTSIYAYEDVTSKVDELWDNRHDTAAVYESIATLEEAASKEGNARIYWRLSRCYYWLGEREAETRGDILGAFNIGKDYAEKAVEMDPKCIDSNYWHAVLIGKVGETRGILQSLFMVRPMHDALKTVLELDPDYASAHYVLGLLYRKVPRRPISIGNLDLSLYHAQRAVELDPTDLEFLLGLAETHLARRERDLAKELLEQILQAPIKECSPIESEESKQTAAKLLKDNF